MVYWLVQFFCTFITEYMYVRHSSGVFIEHKFMKTECLRTNSELSKLINKTAHVSLLIILLLIIII